MGGSNLADLFESIAGTTPERTAVIAGPRRLTYRELQQLSHRWANLLSSSGVGPGHHVGVALHNTVDHLALLFAAFTLRAVPINVNLRYTTAELRALFAKADLALLVHEPELAPAMTAAASTAVGPVGLLCAGIELQQRLATMDGPPPCVERSGDDRYILFTGGTTGAPKGVLWRHEDLYYGALQGAAPVDGARVRLLPASPLTHGTAQWTALITLLSGGTVVLGGQRGFDPCAVWSLVEGQGVSHLVIVGDAFARPLVDALDAHPHRWDLSELLVVVSGGATLSATMRDRLLEHLPGAVVVDGYGTSETGGSGQMVVFPGQGRDVDHARSGSGLLRFVPDSGTAVLDDSMSPIPPGSGHVGRVARRGHLALGYYNDPERTARTFVDTPSGRWAFPGDLATVDAEGRVVLLGRSERIINTGGEKILAEEVETVLSEHPSVADAIVIGVPDDRWGERVTAVVALDPQRPATAGELVAHCRQHLAGFKTPRQIELVERVPRTASGKLDQRWARLIAGRESRAPEPTG